MFDGRLFGVNGSGGDDEEGHPSQQWEKMSVLRTYGLAGSIQMKLAHVSNPGARSCSKAHKRLSPTVLFSTKKGTPRTTLRKTDRMASRRPGLLQSCCGNCCTVVIMFALEVKFSVNPVSLRDGELLWAGLLFTQWNLLLAGTLDFLVHGYSFSSRSWP